MKMGSKFELYLIIIDATNLINHFIALIITRQSGVDQVEFLSAMLVKVSLIF